MNNITNKRLPLVIYDDDPVYLAFISSFINAYIPTGNFFTVCASSSETEVERFIAASKEPALYLLDIMAKNTFAGFKLANLIRKANNGSGIVFITNYPLSVAFKALYKIQAFNIILKSNRFIKDEIAETLEAAYNHICGEDMFYCYSYGAITHAVSYSKILYFETVKNTRKLILNGKTERIMINGNLKTVEASTNGRFARCHDSYLVNRAMISGISQDKRTIYLKNGQACPCSYNGRKAVAQWIRPQS